MLDAYSAKCREEYYEALENEDFKEILNEKGGVILARVGGHPPWPARYSEPGEWTRMARHRTKKGQICVFFFGTRNYGWVSRSAIQPFVEDLPAWKASKKYNSPLYQQALTEAIALVNSGLGPWKWFYDQMISFKDFAEMEMPCEICLCIADYASDLLVCDRKECRRSYHMNCLAPPLDKVPLGRWLCPECSRQLSQIPHDQPQEPPMAKPDEFSLGVEQHKTTPKAVNAQAAVALKKPKKAKQKEKSLKRKLPVSSPRNETHAPAIKPSKKGRPQTSSAPGGPIDSTAFGGSASAAKPLVGDLHGGDSPWSGDGNPLRDQKLSRLSVNTSNEMEMPVAVRTPMGSVSGDVESEERCFLCGYGGELVVCEFPGCTKVYHKFCLGGFPFPKDEDATWFCPRHVCVLSGESEYVVEFTKKRAQGTRWVLPGKKGGSAKLWKCLKCAVALSESVLPQLQTNQLISKKTRTFLCYNCLEPSLEVQLAKVLEKIWSMMATNRQGMPFCGPLLCGVDRSGDCMDLFKILAKIRQLKYSSSKGFLRDIDQVIFDAKRIIAGRSKPLVEGAHTLRIICDEQVALHRHRLEVIESKLMDASLNGVSYPATKWPVPWRKECMPFDDRCYIELEARTLAEWTAFVTAAPVFTSLDSITLPDRQYCDSEQSPYYRDSSQSIPRENPPVQPVVPQDLGQLTLTEGVDVMMALSDLANSKEDGRTSINGLLEKELQGIDARDFFLSPSSTEMEHMFLQQSELLRKTLESHAALHKAWMISNIDTLGLDGKSGLLVGEGRLAAELRVANKNLKARLRNKDKLVEQLTSDQMSLRSEVRQLQVALQERERRVAELEQALEEKEQHQAESEKPTSKLRAPSGKESISKSKVSSESARGSDDATSGSSVVNSRAGSGRSARQKVSPRQRSSPRERLQRNSRKTASQ